MVLNAIKNKKWSSLLSVGVLSLALTLGFGIVSSMKACRPMSDLQSGSEFRPKLKKRVRWTSREDSKLVAIVYGVGIKNLKNLSDWRTKVQRFFENRSHIQCRDRYYLLQKLSQREVRMQENLEDRTANECMNRYYDLQRLGFQELWAMVEDMLLIDTVNGYGIKKASDVDIEFWNENIAKFFRNKTGLQCAYRYTELTKMGIE